jgi:hypothetical protein
MDSPLDGDLNHDVENVTGSPFGGDMLTGNEFANVMTGWGDSLQDTLDCVDAGDGDTAILDEAGVDMATNCETTDTAPQTSYSGAGGIADGATTSDTTPTYDVTADEAATFEYSVGGGFQACSLNCTLTTPLADGTYVVSIRAVDADENNLRDASPVSRTVTIDTTAPDTAITSGPSGLTGDNTPTFTFMSTESPEAFHCSLDGALPAPCPSPLTTAPLADGPHTLSVRAIDSVSNLDATAATRSFTVDTTAPNTSASGPAKLKLKGKQKTVTANYALGSSEPGSTLQCSLDGGAFAPCSASHSLALRKGTHTLSVRATDAVGNADASPAMVTTRVVKKKKKKRKKK